MPGIPDLYPDRYSADQTGTDFAVVFTFVTSWNDFLWPLVSTSNSDMYTLTVALSLLKTQYQTNYGLIMAGATVSFIFPFIMYVFLQKQFVEGIALSGIKG